VSSDEGVSRAARGALWVIKTTTGKSPVKRAGNTSRVLYELGLFIRFM